MESRIQKWGNSLEIRIPKSFAKEAKIECNTKVEISVEDDRLIIKPIKDSKYRLEDLLSSISKENIHGESDFGEPQGKELL